MEGVEAICFRWLQFGMEGVQAIGFPWLLKVHLQGESWSYTCLFGCMFTLLINSWRTVCTQELEFGVPNYTHFEVWTHLDVKMAVSFVGGCIRFHRCKEWRGKSTIANRWNCKPASICRVFVPDAQNQTVMSFYTWKSPQVNEHETLKLVYLQAFMFRTGSDL
jgi:hypothetical protein